MALTDTLLQQAFSFHQRGDLDRAQELYRQAAESGPRDHRALHLWGVLRSQRGDHARAIELISKALSIQPNDFGAHSNYGLALAGAQRYGEAIASYDRAIALKPDFFQAHYSRGIALANLRRFAEATASFRTALRFQPDNAAALYHLGLSLEPAGQFEEAIACYDRALELAPDLPDGWDTRGNALHALGRDEEALASYAKALAIKPGSARAHYNRGIALAAMNRHEDAIASYDRALAADPNFSAAWTNRGASFVALRLFGEAIKSFDAALAHGAGDLTALTGKAAALHYCGDYAQSLSLCAQVLTIQPGSTHALLVKAQNLRSMAQNMQALAAFDAVLAIQPGDADAWNGRGAVLHALGHFDEALNAFERALAARPDFPDALTSHALLMKVHRGDYDAARAGLERSLALDPGQPFIPGELLHLKMQAGDWSGFDREKAALDQGVRAGLPVARPFVYQAVSGRPADIQECARIFSGRLFAKPVARAFEPRSHAKIRLGYVSGEFKEHATADLMAGLYEQHDRDRFEVVAIDNTGPHASPMRTRLEAAFDKMLDVSQLGDEEASKLIRTHEIDILIDLNGYFGAPRTALFAQRSAPVQVNYLGFPGTLGAAFMDYIIADEVVIPDGDRAFYDEKVVWLPSSYQANDARRAMPAAPPARGDVGLPAKAFVFCSFNQSYKLTPDTFASWMRILKATPGSVLWLLDGMAPFAGNLRREVEQLGVKGERIVFAPFVSAEKHLQRLACADLFLDSLPCNAHTTASDALWAGLPVLTCLGSSFPGRVASSLLKAAGLPELCTQTAEEFEALAIRLAGSPAELNALRTRLHANRRSSPLFDTGLFRKHIEAAYAGMWNRYENGLPPDHFALQPG
ncbi:MAG: tetratricopeptide repeat protein [Alphaproteobacteria bacterium]